MFLTDNNLIHTRSQTVDKAALLFDERIERSNVY